MSPQPELILESSIVRSGAPTLILLSSMVSIEHPSPTIFDFPANRKIGSGRACDRDFRDVLQ
jgi:hypothetical protein